MIENFQDILSQVQDVLQDSSKTFYGWAAVKPEPKQSTTFGSGHAYTTGKKAKYLNELREQFRASFNEVTPWEGPVRLTILYCFPWRLKDEGYTAKSILPMVERPDEENLSKPVKDALEGILYLNDSQVVGVTTLKIRYIIPCILLKAEFFESKIYNME